MARARSPRARLCDMCGSPMRKNGTTSAGKQRWRCDSCHTSSVRRREDSTRIAQFHAFLRWVTGTASMQAAAASIGVSTPTFLRAIDWCWKVRPRLGDGGVPHRFVEVDGTYVPYGWCMLVAVDEDGSPICLCSLSCGRHRHCFWTA